jgi:site-specific recombinase XerD
VSRLGDLPFDRAIDEFFRDKRDAGQINSDRTVLSYRSRLECHLEDIENRDPRYTTREDVKRTLRRWTHPNTQANARAILVSFYRWTVEEGLRTDNPAEQTRRPKRRQASVYRLKRAEAVAIMQAAQTARERRIVYLGLLVGARNQELRGLQLRHFTKQAGAVWISRDIAKGGRERYLPVLPELEPVVVEILANVGPLDYVIAARRSVGGRYQTIFRETPCKQCSGNALRENVIAIAKRAQIGAHIHPHLLRHAFGDHVTRQAGLRAAQAMLGHASIDTTESTYTGGVTLDELTAAVGIFRYAEPIRSPSVSQVPVFPLEAPSGFEPENPSVRAIERDLPTGGSE